VGVIKRRGKEWVLFTWDGKRVLGRHLKREDAEKQEAARQRLRWVKHGRGK